MHGSDVKDLNVITRSRKTRRETTVSHLSGPWSVGSNNKHVKDEDRDWWNRESVDITVDNPIEVRIKYHSGCNPTYFRWAYAGRNIHYSGYTMGLTPIFNTDHYRRNIWKKLQRRYCYRRHHLAKGNLSAT